MIKHYPARLVYFFLAFIATVVVYYIVLSGLNIVPLAKDSWQQIQSPSVKYRNVGRWTNFILYAYKHNVPPIMGLILDGLSFAFIGYSILLPLLKRIPYIYILLLLLFWISSSPNLAFIGYPGGSTPPNLIVAIFLFFIHKTPKIKYRILLYSIAGILLFGTYESHYFVLFFAYIIRTYLNSSTDIKVLLTEFGIWIFGFIIGYISWQLIHYGIHDKFMVPENNYRTLVVGVDGSYFERVKLILANISNSFNFYSHKKFTLIKYSSHFVITALLICGIYNSSKTEKHVIGLSFIPSIGLVTLLLLANYNFFNRIGLCVWAVILLVSAISLIGKGKKRIIATILLTFLIFSNVIKHKNLIGRQQTNLSASIETILSHIDPEKLSKEDVILVFGNADRKNDVFDPLLCGGMANQLGIKTVWKCKPKTGGNCRKALKYIATEDSFCDPGPKYLGKHSNLHLLKLNKINTLCNN